MRRAIRRPVGRVTISPLGRLNHFQLLPRHVVGGLLVLSLITAVGYGVVSVTRVIETTGASRLVSALALAITTFGVVTILARRIAGGRDWFHPLAFPTLYVTVNLMAPVLFILLTGNPIGSVGIDDVTPTVLAVFGLTIAGLVFGAQAGTMISGGPARLGPRAIDAGAMLAIGRVMLLAMAILRLILLVPALSRPYGFGSVVYDTDQFLAILMNGLVFVGVILVVLANVQKHRNVLGPADLALLGVFTAGTFAAGGRGELMAPAIFALWGQHTWVRPFRLRSVLALSLATVVVFEVVGNYRVGREAFPEEPTEFVERALTPLSIPLLITANVVERVPMHHPFAHGSTYLAALKRQLPGPAAVSLFGQPSDTGTFVYRDLINFRDPNSGFAFALPSESYLNFGLAGSLAVPLLVGLLFGWAYRKSSLPPSRALHVLYPILVATLPLGLRADALLQIKMVLYPVIGVALVFRLCAARPPGLRRSRSAGSIPPDGLSARSGTGVREPDSLA